LIDCNYSKMEQQQQDANTYTESLKQLMKILEIKKPIINLYSLKHKQQEICGLLQLLSEEFPNERIPSLNADEPALGIVLFILNKNGIGFKRERQVHRLTNTYSQIDVNYHMKGLPAV